MPAPSSARRWCARRLEGIASIAASSDGEASPSARVSVIASRAGSASAACIAARRPRSLITSVFIDSILTELSPVSQDGGVSDRSSLAGLLLVIFALARTGRAGTAPAAVGAYIGVAYWFTSSTSFANPAITVGRMFSDTFAGIAPSSAPLFIAAQVGGGIAGVLLIRFLYPALSPAQAADAVVPHEDGISARIVN